MRSRRNGPKLNQILCCYHEPRAVRSQPPYGGAGHWMMWVTSIDGAKQNVGVGECQDHSMVSSRSYRFSRRSASSGIGGALTGMSWPKQSNKRSNSSTGRSNASRVAAGTEPAINSPAYSLTARPRRRAFAITRSSTSGGSSIVIATAVLPHSILLPHAQRTIQPRVSLCH